MFNFRNVAMIFGVVFVLTACDAQTSGDIEFDASEIVYEKDERTNLCYGALASRESSLLGLDMNMTGMGFTEVPCDKVKDYVN